MQTSITTRLLHAILALVLLPGLDRIANPTEQQPDRVQILDLCHAPAVQADRGSQRLEPGRLRVPVDSACRLVSAGTFTPDIATAVVMRQRSWRRSVDATRMQTGRSPPDSIS